MYCHTLFYRLCGFPGLLYAACKEMIECLSSDHCTAIFGWFGQFQSGLKTILFRLAYGV